ncbi:MAG: hypothetical protein Q8O00_11890 [Holophaga sp.]|nr:hypothetical protein [Holophaga sp.]
MKPPAMARMLISKEQNRYKEIDAAKTSGGQFYTTQEHWLTDPVVAFIQTALNHSPGFLDPFAGEGHLLEACAARFQRPIAGLDLHAASWPTNDSLRQIPATASVIITNPPYLAKHSASRKGVAATVAAYYGESGLDDLYQIALHHCLKAARYTVAIIPETFLNSVFPKHNLDLVSVLEKNPFDDTENPVCVACFDTQATDGEQTARAFMGNNFCGTLGDIFALRRTVPRDSRIRFNNPRGEIALRAVDSTDPAAPIGFLLAEAFAYGRENIKVSSRLLTYLSIQGLPRERRPELVAVVNRRLAELREASHDLVLSPFKGNNREGRRRRRLDYALARVLLVESLAEIG